MPFPFIPLAIAAGSSLLGSFLGGGGKTESPEKQELLDQFMGQLPGEKREARASRVAQQEYDPNPSVKAATEANLSPLFRDLFYGVEGLTGGAVGAGRLKTGFFTDDVGRFLERGMTEASSGAARIAMTGEQLKLRNIEGRAGAQDRYPEMLASGMDILTAEENAEKQRKAQLGNTIGNIGGWIGGAMLRGGTG